MKIKEKVKIEMLCGKFWISQKELPLSEPLRKIMTAIIGCQPNDCRDKKSYLSLVKYTAKDLIKDLKKI